MADVGELEIVRIGAQGDGVAEAADGLRFVPFALPGETWQEVSKGTYDQRTAAAERVIPPCPHFGTCGGCVAQHMNDALYAAWKSGLVGQALAHQGIDIDLQPMWRAPPGSRRRVVLSAGRHTQADAGWFQGGRIASTCRDFNLYDCGPPDCGGGAGAL